MSTAGPRIAGSRIVPGPDQQVESTPELLTLGSYLHRGQASTDVRRLFLTGGRGVDTFYRHRWNHNRVAHSAHGINCTESYTQRVYVFDGAITWERQIADYPTTGPDIPEYGPHDHPRSTASSRHTYSPMRVHHPYVCLALLDIFRATKADDDGDPITAWAQVINDPATAKACRPARGKGGAVRVGWDEAVEVVAVACVHTART